MYDDSFDLTLVHYGWESVEENAKYGKSIRAEKVRKDIWNLCRETWGTEGGVWRHVKIPPGRDESRPVEIVLVGHGGFSTLLVGKTGKYWVTRYG